MDKNTSPLETLTEIRQLMERSSRFISLSGLSGIFAGIYALTGAFIAYVYLQLQGLGYLAAENILQDYTRHGYRITFLAVDALLILLFAVGTGIFLTTRKAKKMVIQFFDNAAKRLVTNLCIPLVTGGVFCIAMIYHGALIFVPSSMLIFYGIALVHASHFTRSDIRVLGILELILGITASFFIGFGFLFWCLGFGVLHILYGAYMYFKYEK